MRYSSRLFLYAPFVILLVIAAAAMLRWRQLASEWETTLRAANRGEEIAPGVTLRFASETIGGLPFNLDVVFDKLVLAVHSTRGPISLESEHFAIHALTYGRAQQIFEAAGTQILTWTDTEGKVHRFVFVPGTMRASAIENNGRLSRFDLDLNAFGSQTLSGARAQLHMRAEPDLLDFVVRADGLRLSSTTASVPHLEFEGQMTPSIPLSALLSGHDEWRRALGGWRAAHGLFRIGGFDIAMEDSRLSARGTLALDDRNRLSGEVAMHVLDAARWKPATPVASRFTLALQDLMNEPSRRSPSSPLALTLDIHNGAAIVRAAGQSRNAGSIDPFF